MDGTERNGATAAHAGQVKVRGGNLLAAKHVDRIAKRGVYPDGRGLALFVSEGGSKLWRFRFVVGGKASMLSLGTYPETSLAHARERRDDARKLIARGVRPALLDGRIQPVEVKDARKAAQAQVFKAVAEAWFDRHKAAWSDTHRRDVRRMLAEIVTHLGARPIRAIRTADVQAMLGVAVARGAVTYAHDLRLYVGTIIRDYNRQQPDGERVPNPAELATLPKPRPQQHHASLTATEIPAFLRALDAAKVYVPMKVATRMLLLTGVRTMELLAAQWREFDEGAALWRIPGDRMKNRAPHVVPLSSPMIALLAELRPLTGATPYLFPNRPARKRRKDGSAPALHANENTILYVINAADFKGRLTGHGFRAMLSTWAHESGFPSDAIERQLAHAPADKVKAAYLRSDFLDARRAMMQAWADYLTALHAGAQVIPFRQGAG